MLHERCGSILCRRFSRNQHALHDKKPVASVGDFPQVWVGFLGLVLPRALRCSDFRFSMLKAWWLGVAVPGP